MLLKMAIEIVDLPSYKKNMIFQSYFSLPEGNIYVYIQSER